MVRPAAAALAAALLAAPAAAADWSQAGGGLFVGTPPPVPAPAPDALPAHRGAWPDPPFAAAIAAAAERHGLDPKLLRALVAVESAHRPEAQSPAGALGLTQLMPATAAELGVADPLDPDANLQGGAQYLARQLVRFGDLRLALAAYNSGPERVGRLGRVPRIPETERYVDTVVQCFLSLTAGRAVRSARDCRPGGSPP